MYRCNNSNKNVHKQQATYEHNNRAYPRLRINPRNARRKNMSPLLGSIWSVAKYRRAVITVSGAALNLLNLPEPAAAS